MRLYTSQPKEVYDRLMRGETWTADPYAPGVADEPMDESDRNFQRAYDWMCQQMLARGISPSNPDTKYPVWAYFQWYGVENPAPDLTCESIRSYAEKGTQVLLTLDIDDSRVLLSDYDAWHWVLNVWYMGSEAASDDFEARCHNVDAGYRNAWPLRDPGLHQEMVASWHGIFDNNVSAEVVEQTPDSSTIQAVFWELSLSDVVSAVQFDVTGPLVNLPIRTDGSIAACG